MRYFTHLVFTGLLYLTIQSHALAGTFTPAAGAEITQNPFTVSWDTSAPQQWVRAYDANSGDKFFDSGRLRTGSGSVSVDVPDNISDISVIFYEYVGSWESQERTYVVNLGGGGDGSSVIVSERISCEDEVGPQLVPELGDLDPNFEPLGPLGPILDGFPVLRCDLTCPNDEYLIATTCNVQFSQGGLAFPYITTLIPTFTQDASSGECLLYGQQEQYAASDGIGFDGTGLQTAIFDFRLYASGACMSVP